MRSIWGKKIWVAGLLTLLAAGIARAGAPGDNTLFLFTPTINSWNGGTIEFRVTKNTSHPSAPATTITAVNFYYNASAPTLAMSSTVPKMTLTSGALDSTTVVPVIDDTFYIMAVISYTDAGGPDTITLGATDVAPPLGTGTPHLIKVDNEKPQPATIKWIGLTYPDPSAPVDRFYRDYDFWDGFGKARLFWGVPQSKFNQPAEPWYYQVKAESTYGVDPEQMTRLYVCSYHIPLNWIDSDLGTPPPEDYTAVDPDTGGNAAFVAEARTPSYLRDASDGTGSGVAGVIIEVGQTPPSSYAVGTTVTANYRAKTDLYLNRGETTSNSTAYWIATTTVDFAGNRAETLHYGPIWLVRNPVVTCPPGQTDLQCVSDIPAPYATVQDLLDAGGTLFPPEADPSAFSIGSSDADSGTGCEADPFIRVRTYTLTDFCGNLTNCTQTFTVVDTTAPTLPTLPTGGYLGCNPALPVCATALTATDNCGAVVPVLCTPGPITGDCNKTQIFTYTATDTCGNAASATVTYTWKADLVAPVFAGCPTASIDLGCNPPAPACADALALVTATDACDGAITPTCMAGDIASQGCLRSQTFTLTATDICGNPSTCTVTYTWKADVVGPVFAGCPTAPIDLGCNPAAPTGANALALVTATDACDGLVTPVSVAGAVIENGCLRSQAFTLTATDACGNPSTCTVAYTWKVDVAGPVFSGCPTASIDLGCNPTAPTCATALALVTATDACDGAVTPTCVAGTVVTNGCLRTQTFTLTATDLCLNASTCTVTYTWKVDVAGPVFSGCPTASIDLGCNPTAPTCATALALVTATDACDGAVTPTCVAGTVVTNGCLRSQTFTLTATDDCTNASTCTVTYTWKVDGVAPVFAGCPTAPIDLGCNPTAPTCATALALVTATDACDGAVTPTCVAGTVVTNGCQRSQDFTLTATDSCGNPSACTVTYTWKVDVAGPVFSGCPTASIDLGCNPTAPTCATALALVTATDACDGAVTPTCVAGTVVTNGCQRSQNFTLTATDDCTNASTCTVTYIWKVDLVAPVFAGCPAAPIDLGLNPIEPVCADALALVTATDACDGAVTPTCMANNVASDGCLRTQSFTLTAADICGNQATCTVTYTWIVDTAPPEFRGCPQAPIDLGCNPPEPTCADALALVTVMDACGGAITPTCAAGSVTADGCRRGQSFTLTATDGQNTSTCTVTYTWKVDLAAPVFSGCPTASIDLGCNPPAPTCATALALVTATDVCDGAVTPTCVAGGVVVNGCMRTQAFTLTATDLCDNDAACTVTYVWKVDQDAPSFSGCPTASIDLGCNPTAPTCATALALVTATDVCDGAVTPTCMAGTVVTDGCQRSQTFTLTATDLCDNAATCTVTYTWKVDLDDPTFTGCPTAAIDLGCNPPAPTCADAVALVSASDQCDDVITPTCAAAAVVVNGCVRSQAFTLTATDGCGNTATCMVTYTWKVDLDDPTFTGCPTAPIELGCNPPAPTCAGALALVTANDLCDGAITPTCMAADVISQGCLRSQAFTLTAVDSCDNDATCTVTYTWKVDLDAPVFTGCPTASIDLGCNPPAPACADALALVTAADACDGAVTPTCAAGAVVENGCLRSQTFTLTATDLCGNASTCAVTYAWKVDLDAPAFSGCPTASIDLGCNPPAPTCVDALALVTATDACDGAVTPVCVAGSVLENGCLRSQAFTLTATDLCLNGATCTVTYTWKVDLVAPVFSGCPTASIDLGCNPTAPTCVDALALVTATDACDGAVAPTCAAGTVVADDCLRVQIFTLTAKDGCDNSTICTVTYTWTVDLDPPVFTGCPTAVVDLGMNPVEPTCTDAWALVTVDDGCDVQPGLDCTAGVITGDECNKTQIFTLTATDACNNTATCTVTYTWTVETVTLSVGTGYTILYPTTTGGLGVAPTPYELAGPGNWVTVPISVANPCSDLAQLVFEIEFPAHWVWASEEDYGCCPIMQEGVGLRYMVGTERWNPARVNAASVWNSLAWQQGDGSTVPDPATGSPRVQVEYGVAPYPVPGYTQAPQYTGRLVVYMDSPTGEAVVNAGSGVFMWLMFRVSDEITNFEQFDLTPSVIYATNLDGLEVVSTVEPGVIYADACNWLLDVDRNGRVDPDTDGVTLYRALKYGHILDDMDCTVVPILPPDYAAFAASYLPCDPEIVWYVSELLMAFDLNVDDSAPADGDNIPEAIGYAAAVSASRDGVYIYRNLSYYFNDIYPRYDTTLAYTPFVNPVTPAGSTNTVPAGHPASADAVNAQVDLLKIYGCPWMFAGKGPAAKVVQSVPTLPCWWMVNLPAGVKTLPLPQAPWSPCFEGYLAY